ncbi:MAG: hypothetical protein ACXVIU_13435 [Halobacteriota archaeon]
MSTQIIRRFDREPQVRYPHASVSTDQAGVMRQRNLLHLLSGNKREKNYFDLKSSDDKRLIHAASALSVEINTVPLLHKHIIRVFRQQMLIVAA